jgi:large subunit ribosomal protein L18
MSKIFTFDKNLRKKRRVGTKIFGQADRPRITVFRSGKYIYTQAIDDEKKVTLASFSSLVLRKKNQKKMTKTEESKSAGLELAKILKEKKINQAVFDRGYYQYHGRVAALCDGLREGGIKI